MKIPLIQTALALLLLAGVTTGRAEEPAKLKKAKSEYERSAATGGEAARLKYVNSLCELLGADFKEFHRTGNREHAAEIEALTAELKKHPSPRTVDAAKLSQLRVGTWQTPRHDLVYRKDGTWSMLPLEKGGTHGGWQIRGNQYVQTWAAGTAKPTTYTIINLTGDWFAYMDNKTGTVFMEWRTSKR